MVYIRNWVYKEMIRIDLGELWPLYKVLLVMIVLLGIIVDCVDFIP